LSACARRILAELQKRKLNKPALSVHTAGRKLKIGYRILRHAQFHQQMRNGAKRGIKMKMIDRMKERAATGYILLWLLGIPIPILLLIFLLRGCT
jgi:hypothetical protein